MCGIVGLRLSEASCDPAVLIRMRDLLTHRGPDDAGSFIDGPLGLGHRRLSIIDLGGGHQPMSTADGRLTIVFNGEIYNYKQLRRELISDGAVFHTESDTEVILQLHAVRGDAAVPVLNGIFAYALWDRVSRRLLLVRDRAGIKPLYYASTDAGIVFASEAKALFASGLVTAEMNWHCVTEYLTFRHVSGPESLFRGVESLPPGHMLDVTSTHVGSPRSYWRVVDPPSPFLGSFSDAVDCVDETLRDAVGRQLVADVPLGTFCSGGVDSSLVTALAAKHSAKPIKTFSVGFHEQSYDESSYARQASDACGTEHHELRIDQERFADLLPELIWYHDLPLNFANSVHIYAVSQLARAHVTVVLTGEGADELFGGYPRYSIPKIVQWLVSMPPALRQLASTAFDRATDHRLRRIEAMLGRPPGDAILFNSTSTDPRLVEWLIGRAVSTADFPYRCSRVDAARLLYGEGFGAVAQSDFETYLVSILDRQDKMSMATSLEARVPFLDNAIIDLARSLPQHYKQTLRHRKRVLKAVARRYLPEDIVSRRKSGFGVPLAEWFRGNGPMALMLDDALADRSLQEIVPVSRVRELVHQHRSATRDHGELLWALLNLSLWRTRFRC